MLVAAFCSGTSVCFLPCTLFAPLTPVEGAPTAAAPCSGPESLFPRCMHSAMTGTPDSIANRMSPRRRSMVTVRLGLSHWQYVLKTHARLASIYGSIYKFLFLHVQFNVSCLVLPGRPYHSATRLIGAPPVCPSFPFRQERTFPRQLGELFVVVTL